MGGSCVGACARHHRPDAALLVSQFDARRLTDWFGAKLHDLRLVAIADRVAIVHDPVERLELALGDRPDRLEVGDQRDPDEVVPRVAWRGMWVSRRRPSTSRACTLSRSVRVRLRDVHRLMSGFGIAGCRRRSGRSPQLRGHGRRQPASSGE